MGEFILPAMRPSALTSGYFSLYVAITNIYSHLMIKNAFSFSSFPLNPFSIFTEVIACGLAKRLTDSEPY